MLLLRIVPLLLLALPAQAQLKGAEWQAYTSMRNINRLLVHQDAVWAITSGGVLRSQGSHAGPALGPANWRRGQGRAGAVGQAALDLAPREGGQ